MLLQSFRVEKYQQGVEGEALSDLKVSMIAKQCVLVEILYAVPHILERGRENLKHVTSGGTRI